MDEKSIEQVVEQALGKALGPITQQIGQEFHKIDERLKQHANIQAAAHEKTRKEVRHVAVVTDTLWKQINGSTPPPKDDGDPNIGLNGTKDLVKTDEPIDAQLDGAKAKLSAHDADIDSLRGRVIVIDERVEKALEVGKQALEIGEKVLALQEKQTSAMGIKKDDEKTTLADLLKWAIKEKEGQKFVLAVFTALTTLTGAIGTVYALWTGRLPMPNAPVSAPPVVYQEPPHAPPSTSAYPGP